MGIVSVSFWKDIGYLEGSAETPLPSQTPLEDLGTPDLIIQDSQTPHEVILNPSKGRLFNELKLKQVWTDLKDMSYCYIYYQFNESTFSMFAWIDGVSLQSDTDNYPLSIVDFHIDYWRTYINQVTLERGTVLRKPYVAPSTSNWGFLPPQTADYLKIQPNYFYDEETGIANGRDEVTLTPLAKTYDGTTAANSDTWYVIFSYTDENSSGDTTTTTFGYFPFNMSGKDLFIADKVYSGGSPQVYRCPNVLNVMRGNWDELLGLTPSRVKGAWLSPVAPFKWQESNKSVQYRENPYSTSWTTGNKYIYELTPTETTDVSERIWEYKEVETTNPSIQSQQLFYGYFLTSVTNVVKPVINPFTTYTRASSASDNFERMSTDLVFYKVTDFNGVNVGDLPWATDFTYYDYRIILSAITAYIEIRIRNSDKSFTYWDPINSHNTGTCYTIPLPALEVTENSWSEYNYTGAREFERDQRQTELNYQRSSAYADAWSTIGVGAAMSGVGAVAGGASSLISGLGGWAAAPIASSIGKTGEGMSMMGMGSIASGASSLISTYTHEQLGLEEKHNMELDRASNQYQAKLTDAMLLAGDSFDILFNGSVPKLRGFTYDTYGRSVLTNKLEQYGAECFYPVSSCQSYLNTAGPLQIDNLNVTGDVPVDAKLYIANRLKRGVILVEE